MKETTDKELERKNINERFRYARWKIQNLLGINLQLGELVELRKDVEFVYDLYCKDYKKLKDKGLMCGDKHLILPDDEASIMFMNRNYGTDFKNLEEKNVKGYFDKRIEASNLAGYDYYAKYFNKVQEDMHFP